MNFRQVLCQLGLLFLVLSVLQLVIASWAGIEWLFGEPREREAFAALLISAGVGALLGLAAWFLNRRFQEWLVGRREALLLVGMTWILGAALCGLPYHVWARLADAATNVSSHDARPAADVDTALEPRDPSHSPSGEPDAAPPGVSAERLRDSDEPVDLDPPAHGTPLPPPPAEAIPPGVEPDAAAAERAIAVGAHPFNAFTNCYFEAMSGLTTTGATILTEIGSVPPSLLLWRALTHWLGGLGIVVLFVAVLPSLGAGGKKLFRVEAPGPQPEGVRPHIAETARVLWLIYVGLTVVQTVCLRLAGMSWFDAVCHTFATLATGGFSTMDTSLGGYTSSVINIVTIVFMVLAGVNFGIYYNLFRRRFGSVWRDPELRLYLLLLVVASTVVTISIIDRPMTLTTGDQLPPGVATALEHGVFQVVSIQTTTGFCTADFNRWPFVAQAVLVLLMFVGGSAGSTAGGIKVIRVWIMLKVMAAEIERSFRPNVVRPLKIGAGGISPELRLATLAYVLGAILIFAGGAFFIMVIERHPDMTFVTAAGASAATFFNVGPGLGAVGAVENYSWMSPASKTLLSLLMALGRLELFAIVVLFVPRFWRGD